MDNTSYVAYFILCTLNNNAFASRVSYLQFITHGLTLYKQKCLERGVRHVH